MKITLTSQLPLLFQISQFIIYAEILLPGLFRDFRSSLLTYIVVSSAKRTQINIPEVAVNAFPPPRSRKVPAHHLKALPPPPPPQKKAQFIVMPSATDQKKEGRDRENSSRYGTRQNGEKNILKPKTECIEIGEFSRRRRRRRKLFFLRSCPWTCSFPPPCLFFCWPPKRASRDSSALLSI